MSYERLLQEYDEIERLADHLSRLISRSTVDVGEVSASLSTLGIAIDEHLTFERRSIYAAAGARTQVSLRLKTLDRSCLQKVQADWQQHLADWIGHVIQTEWPTFQQETAVMLGRLTEHMRGEAEQLYPLALQHGLMRLRDPTRAHLGTCSEKAASQPSA